MLKWIFKNTSFQILGRLVVVITGVLITRRLTTGLSQPDYGWYVLITDLIIQLVSWLEWGTGFVAVRSASEKRFPPGQLFANLLGMRLTGAALASLLFVILGKQTWLNIPLTYLQIGLIIIWLNTVKNVFVSILHSYLKFGRVAVVESVTNLVYLGLIYLIPGQLKLATALLSLASGNLLTLLLAVWWTYHLFVWQPVFRAKIVKYILRESAPIGAQLVIFSLYNRLDLYLIKYFLNLRVVAQYGLAYKIYTHLAILAASLTSVLFPVISRQQADKRASRRVIKQGLILLLAGGAGAAIGLHLTAPWLVNWLAGADYQASVVYLRILSWAVVFAYLNHLTGYSLTALHRQKVFLYTAVIALCFNLALNWYLIPRYGAFMAAWLTVATEGLSALISGYYLYRVLHER